MIKTFKEFIQEAPIGLRWQQDRESILFNTDMMVPITSDMYKILSGNEKQAIAWHVTSLGNINGVIKYQKKKTGLSVEPSPQPNVRYFEDGVSGSGAVFLLKGNMQVKAGTDLMSVPDSGGYRWVPLEQEARSQRSATLQSEYVKIHFNLFKEMVKNMKVTEDENGDKVKNAFRIFESSLKMLLKSPNLFMEDLDSYIDPIWNKNRGEAEFIVNRTEVKSAYMKNFFEEMRKMVTKNIDEFKKLFYSDAAVDDSHYDWKEGILTDYTVTKLYFSYNQLFETDHRREGFKRYFAEEVPFDDDDVLLKPKEVIKWANKVIAKKIKVPFEISYVSLRQFDVKKMYADFETESKKL